MIPLVCRRASLPLLLSHNVAILSCILVSRLSTASDAVSVQRVNREPLRPSHYTIEIQSARSDDKPRLVSTWAHVLFEGERYRALMPTSIVRGPEVLIQFQWAAGSHLAGEVEKVELEWKRPYNGVWQSRLLGEGFREPGNGHLILSPTKLYFSPEEGMVDLRFMLSDASGRIFQDGGMGSTTKIQVVAHEASSVLQFTQDWKISQQGQLREGKSFELKYALERIEQQLLPTPGGVSSPWCLFAKIQFDDGSVQSYPLLASHREHPEKVVALLPTVQIPEQARRMTIWFFAFHNTKIYFDSNFGQNYHFQIMPR